LIIGANIYLNDQIDYKYRFSRKDLIVAVIIKSFIMPFLGVLFSLIANIFIPDNKPLIFASFVQWILPTSIDIITILQVKEINTKDASIIILLQWIIFIFLSNFINIPPFLAAVKLI
jgi:hypothetical protein